MVDFRPNRFVSEIWSGPVPSMPRKQDKYDTDNCRADEGIPQHQRVITVVMKAPVFRFGSSLQITVQARSTSECGFPVFWFAYFHVALKFW